MTLKKATWALLLTLSLTLLFSAVQAAPEMIIDNPEFDFGFVPQHSKISHVFWIKAGGEDSLKILKVVPG